MKKTPLTTIILTVVSVLALLITLFTLFITSVKADVRYKEAKTVTDSTQWSAIQTIKEANGNTNKRVDEIVDKQNTKDAEILKTLQDIQKAQEAQNKLWRAMFQEFKQMQKYSIILDNQTTETQNLKFR
jgi:predicted RND superfamily exporter protein